MGQRWTNYWNRGVTLLILVNLLLVFFNLSYIPLRSQYLEQFPSIPRIYDPIKGIVPHPITEPYLQTVAQVHRSINAEGLQSEQTAALLSRLQQQSSVLVTENPFSSSEQEILFAELKRRMQIYMQDPSAQDAFRRFWQVDHLNQRGWIEASLFFDSQIVPLLRQNYYHLTREAGQPIDRFWIIDSGFILIFAVEFLVRTWIISRRYHRLAWEDVIARHWYEFPLFFPFWRWLRILPAVVRLHRSGLVNVERLISQVTHEPAAYLSDRVVRFALVQMVNQARASVEAGTLINRLSPHEDYTEVGQPGKLERVGDRLIQLIIYGVIPRIRPDLENVLRHNLQSAAVQSNLYERLQQIPGLNILPTAVLNTLSAQLAQTSCDILVESYADTEGRMLVEQLSEAFRNALGQYIQEEITSTEVKGLLIDWLEEIKLNYIQQPAYHDPIAILEEAEQFHPRSRLLH